MTRSTRRSSRCPWSGPGRHPRAPWPRRCRPSPARKSVACPALMPKYPVMSLTADHGQPGAGAGAAHGARPVALVTGAGRTAGIAAGIVRQLAESGWDIAFTYWHAYDDRMPWGPEADATAAITEIIGAQGAACVAIEADLADPG